MHKSGYREKDIMKKKKSKKKIIIGAAAVLVVAGGVTVAGQRNSTENQIPQVQVVTAEKGDVEEIVDATGTVGSEEEKTYYSPVNAELKTVSFSQGDVVKKGTKLIEFNTEDLEKDNRKAELNLKSTKYDTKDTRNKSDKAEKKQKDAKKNVQELEKKIKDKKAYVLSLKSQISAAQREAAAQASAQAAAQAAAQAQAQQQEAQAKAQAEAKKQEEKVMNMKKMGLFAAGVLFGTAGIKLLSSKDAKKVYTNCTAAALRAKECVMKTASNIQENAEDIYAEAQQINEDRAAKAAEYTDESVEDATEETVAE